MLDLSKSILIGQCERMKLEKNVHRFAVREKILERGSEILGERQKA